MSHRDLKHPRSGGAERAIYEIGRRLVEKGHAVKWYSVKPPSLTKEDIIDGITIRRIQGNIPLHLSVPFLLRKCQIHDIVVDDLGHGVPWGSESFFRNGVVFFRHLHSRSLPGQVSLPVRVAVSGLEALYPLIYRKWPFITESDSSVSDLLNLGIQRSRIRKILPGLNKDNFISAEKEPDPAMVYFGGMRDYKRPWECLYVFSGIRKLYPRTRLYVVGGGPSLNRVRDVADNLGLRDSVTFFGRLSYKDLMSLVSRSWVNIHSSVTEGFGLSILEAAACGVPTVAYSVPGVRDVIIQGSNGILVPDGDRASLIDGVLRIFDNYPSNWPSASVNVAKLYSWDKTANEWEKLMEEIIEKR